MQRQSYIIILMLTVLPWLLCLTGCQQQSRPESSFVLVDKYLEYLWPNEKEAWLQSVKSKGMEATMRQLPFPSSLWSVPCNGYGPMTPKGTLTEAEYIEYSQEGASVTRRLRELAGNPVTNEAGESAAPLRNAEPVSP